LVYLKYWFTTPYQIRKRKVAPQPRNRKKQYFSPFIAYKWARPLTDGQLARRAFGRAQTRCGKTVMSDTGRCKTKNVTLYIARLATNIISKNSLLVRKVEEFATKQI
jgi:hypothetical protein